MLDAAIKCDSYLIAVVMNYVECKKQNKKLQSTSSKMPVNV